MSQTFKFFIPATIEKATDDKGKSVMKVKGISSTSDEDSDGETLEPIGFDVEPLLKSGFINYNHQTKNSPKAIIGQPTVAKVIKGNQLYIEGFLYPNSSLAREVYDQIGVIGTDSVDRQMGWSIEGIPIERDPNNKNRITKAQITGVAITASPKNGKTFIEIMKSMDAGTLDEDQEKIEEEDEEAEKAMEVADLPVVESVEGGQKLKKKFDQLRKSEIFEIITARLPGQDAIAYEKILNFTINYATTNQMAYNFTSIEKALDTLEETLLIQKSDDSSEDLSLNDFNDDNDDDTPPEDDDEDQDELEKGNGSVILSAAREYAFPGVTEQNITEYLVREGFSLTPSSSTAAQVISEMEEAANGGDVTKLSDGNQQTISKAVEDAMELFEIRQGEMVNRFLGIVTKLNDKLEQIQKGKNDELTTAKEQIEKANTTIKELTGKFNKVIDNDQIRSKSFMSPPSAKAVERFEKGNEGGKMDDNSFSMSNPVDRVRLADRLDAEYQISLTKSPAISNTLEKAIGEFEIGKTIRPEFFPTMNALGIRLFE